RLRAVGERQLEPVLALAGGREDGRRDRVARGRHAKEDVDDVRDRDRRPEETYHVGRGRRSLVARAPGSRIGPEKVATNADRERQSEGREDVDADRVRTADEQRLADPDAGEAAPEACPGPERGHGGAPRREPVEQFGGGRRTESGRAGR